MGLKDRIDAVRMLLDVGVELHGEQSGFVRIVGVKAGFELFAVGVLVTNRVGGQSLNGFGHDSRGLLGQADTFSVSRAITICSCFRFNAS